MLTRESLERAARAIPREARVRLAEQRQSLLLSVRAVVQGARRDLESAGRIIGSWADSIGPRGQRLVARERERIEGRGQRLRSVDPSRVVERGYAILRHRGRVVTRTEEVQVGEEVAAEVRDGSLALRVDSRRKNET